MNRSKSSKRAEASVLMYVILAVLVGALFLKAAQVLLTERECKSEDIAACRISVAAVGRIRPLNALSLSCNTCFADRVETEKTKDKTMQRLSDLLYECYYEFGEGQYDVFSASSTFVDNDQQSRGLADRAHCFVCSQFNLNKAFDGTTPDTKIGMKELETFLKKDHYNQEPRTVYEFLRPALFLREDGSLNLMPATFALQEPSTINQVARSTFSWQGALLGIPLSTVVTKVNDALFSTAGSGADVYYNTLKHADEPYVTVFYQVSDTQWGQVLTKLRELTTSNEEVVPPARVFFTPLSKLKNLDCEALQG